MFKPTYDDMGFIALFLEGFFYGVYSAIFSMYLQCSASRNETNKTHNVIFYSICALYVLSLALFIADISAPVFILLLGFLPDSTKLSLHFIQSTSFGCSDLIAQFILIYRCWIVWGHNIRVIIIPSILTLAFLVTWLVFNDSQYILSDELVYPEWGLPMLFTTLTLSLTVNALVMGLIVFRILKVFRGVKATSDDKILGAAVGSKLRRMIFILIESGMMLFSIQLARLMVSVLWTDTAIRAYNIIVGIHEMLTGITPTIILVRISMGLSFHNEKSMEEVAIGSLRFASSHPNSGPDMGSIVSQDGGDGDISARGSTNGIDIVDRDEHI